MYQGANSLRRLALIGKNIFHSRSQEVYEELLNEKIAYTLIDCSCEKEIPGLEYLFNQFDGISITAPYKKFFFDKVTVRSEEAKKAKCLNCIAKKSGVYWGTNTDYSAVKQCFEKIRAAHKKLDAVVLGDGNMSFITRMILENMNVKYTLLSRKQGNLTPKTNLQKFSFSDGRLVVINTCLKEFVFSGEIPQSALFWDYNYSSLEHMEYLGQRCHYQDGFELLKEQAKYALLFWEEISATK